MVAYVESTVHESRIRWLLRADAISFSPAPATASLLARYGEVVDAHGSLVEVQRVVVELTPLARRRCRDSELVGDRSGESEV